jgi:4-hydroxyphenylpyruvate dioxygenase
MDIFGAKGSPCDTEFDWLGERDPVPASHGINYIDHLANNVFRGAMDRWYHFYQILFGFRQIRYFDISGQKPGYFRAP